MLLTVGGAALGPGPAVRRYKLCGMNDHLENQLQKAACGGSADAPAYSVAQLEQHMRLLARTSASLARDIDPETMLAYVARGAAGGTHATKAALLLYDGLAGAFKALGSGVGFSEEFLSGLSLRACEARASERCFTDGIVILAERGAGDSDGGAEMALLDARNLLIAPVRHGGKSVGLLYVADKTAQYREFNGSDRTFVQSLLNQLESSLLAAKLREQVSTLAAVDPSTGLYNQRFFDQVVTLEVQRAERLGHPLGCAIFEVVDLDKFSGEGAHPRENAVRYVGDVARGYIRKIDTVARYDVATIIVLLPGSRLDGCRVVAERILVRARESNFPCLAELRLRAGFSCYPINAKSARELVSTALKDARSAEAGAA